MTAPAHSPRLAFEAVTAAAENGYECGADRLTFALAPGELLWITVPSTHARTPLADLAGGLLEPAAGAIRFEGVDWRERKPEEAAACRARIGRVFETGGWISNLDVDENITLATRYHTGRADPEVLAEADALARELGQTELFRARPQLVSRSELRRSQWVRALLGAPDLLLLERPTRDVPPDWRPPFAEAVRRALTRGASALWITSDAAEAGALGLKPALHLQLRDEKLTAH